MILFIEYEYFRQNKNKTFCRWVFAGKYFMRHLSSYYFYRPTDNNFAGQKKSKKNEQNILEVTRILSENCVPVLIFTKVI